MLSASREVSPRTSCDSASVATEKPNAMTLNPTNSATSRRLPPPALRQVQNRLPRSVTHIATTTASVRATVGSHRESGAMERSPLKAATSTTYPAPPTTRKVSTSS
jgi:hypothetical protein